MKRVLILGGYELGNLGDDALALSTAIYCLKSGIECTFESKQSAYVPTMIFRELNFMPHDTTADYEAIIYGGGTLFYSYSNAQSQSKIIRFSKKVYSVIKKPKVLYDFFYSMLKIRKASKTSDIIMLGMGFGPFHGNKLQLSRVRDIASNTKIIGVRDVKSLDCLDEINVSNTFLMHDLCLTREFSDYLKTNGNKPPVNTSDLSKTYLTVIPRDWNRTENGKLLSFKLKRYCGKVLEDGKGINFQFYSLIEDQEWKSFAEGLQSRYPDLVNITTWNPRLESMRDFICQLEDTEFVISMRFHGAIFSMLLQAPCFIVPIDQKLTQLSARYGLREWNDQIFSLCKYSLTLDTETALNENSDLLIKIFEKIS
ncbi:polysaccharide pyruvyl transferase family protein [Pseudidiomarina halophila]|uniref:Polysaccharide pyruvyl transferase domain-containing protein n=1 Tax=Pseudidiomarina halophila TaxID=1449799 RepID=A0A432XYS7_9GAMM|nr:polysaccharide pyruvyl transferase family protein [Pseudidiomarina halophila]RUO53915.1 hypothetical protein CWI69_00285 [Pseudidiomarina halophila]